MGILGLKITNMKKYSGEGKLKEVFEKIWELALPYQDKRDDAGHAEVTLRFAKELAVSEHGNENVMIPAIILHDVGWSQLVKERRMLIFDKDATDEVRRQVQIEHQNEGVLVAGGILREVGYPPVLAQEILEIISQHDTREGFVSRNEGLVRDADKLSRTSQEGFASGKRRGQSPDPSRWQKMEEGIYKPGYFYSDTARKIAAAELKLRKQESSLAQSASGPG
jgi:hypothetical protein